MEGDTRTERVLRWIALAVCLTFITVMGTVSVLMILRFKHPAP